MPLPSQEEVRNDTRAIGINSFPSPWNLITLAYSFFLTLYPTYVHMVIRNKILKMKRACVLAEAPERRSEVDLAHSAASIWGEEPLGLWWHRLDYE